MVIEFQVVRQGKGQSTYYAKGVTSKRKVRETLQQEGVPYNKIYNIGSKVYVKAPIGAFKVATPQEQPQQQEGVFCDPSGNCFSIDPKMVAGSQKSYEPVLTPEAREYMGSKPQLPVKPEAQQLAFEQRFIEVKAQEQAQEQEQLPPIVKESAQLTQDIESGLNTLLSDFQGAATIPKEVPFWGDPQAQKGMIIGAATAIPALPFTVFSFATKPIETVTGIKEEFLSRPSRTIGTFIGGAAALELLPVPKLFKGKPKFEVEALSGVILEESVIKTTKGSRTILEIEKSVSPVVYNWVTDIKPEVEPVIFRKIGTSLGKGEIIEEGSIHGTFITEGIGVQHIFKTFEKPKAPEFLTPIKPSTTPTDPFFNMLRQREIPEAPKPIRGISAEEQAAARAYSPTNQRLLFEEVVKEQTKLKEKPLILDIEEIYMVTPRSAVFSLSKASLSLNYKSEPSLIGDSKLSIRERLSLSERPATRISEILKGEYKLNTRSRLRERLKLNEKSRLRLQERTVTRSRLSERLTAGKYIPKPPIIGKKDKIFPKTKKAVNLFGKSKKGKGKSVKGKFNIAYKSRGTGLSDIILSAAVKKKSKAAGFFKSKKVRI